MNKKTALVTGAGGGLGHATVERLAAAGWTVFEADIDETMLRSSVHDPDVFPVVMDVTDDESIQSAFDTVSSQTDRLDAIVNFAGIMGVGSLVDMPAARFERILDINLLGTFRVNKAFFSLVEAAKGRIVNISSESGWQSPPPFAGPYSISKHAIEAYSTSLRREVALVGVKVIVIQPGSFKTNMASGIEPAFTLAADESPRFGALLHKLKGLAVKAAGKAGDPNMLAHVIEMALTESRPKLAYSVKPDKARSALELLPARAVDQIYLSVLRRGQKD